MEDLSELARLTNALLFHRKTNDRVLSRDGYEFGFDRRKFHGNVLLTYFLVALPLLFFVGSGSGH